ncbi:MAG: hypothetical protein HXY41_13700 [Chloroflexi bacterium]|nr:hypothetical protein [Chloroflexota bacterium]
MANRITPAASWPFETLVAVLLKQFKRPLAAQGLDLTDAAAQAIARDVTARRDPGEMAQAVVTALAAGIAESETVLARWGLSFRESLATGMDAVPGWNSTAEFLEIANEKANAEIRIGAGAALLAALGDLRYTRCLFDLIEHDPEEVEAVIARRVLLFISGVDGETPDWLEQARAWVQTARAE